MSRVTLELKDLEAETNLFEESSANDDVIQHLESIEPASISPEAKVLALNKKAEDNILRGNLDDANKLLEYAMDIIEKQCVEPQLVLATTLTNLGSLHCLMESFQKALSCFDKVVAYTGQGVDALLFLKYCTAFSGENFLQL